MSMAYNISAYFGHIVRHGVNDTFHAQHKHRTSNLFACQFQRFFNLLIICANGQQLLSLVPAIHATHIHRQSRTNLNDQ